MKKYRLRYLPTAYQDLDEITDYIKNVLLNPLAAENVLDKIESAILERLEAPESFAIWETDTERPYPYRRINVGNYSVWYVVLDDVMEIRRILYAKRDEANLLS